MMLRSFPGSTIYGKSIFFGIVVAKRSAFAPLPPKHARQKTKVLDLHRSIGAVMHDNEGLFVLAVKMRDVAPF